MDENKYLLARLTLVLENQINIQKEITSLCDLMDKRLVIKSSKDIFKDMYNENPNLNKSETARLLGVSRKTIYKYLKN